MSRNLGAWTKVVSGTRQSHLVTVVTSFRTPDRAAGGDRGWCNRLLNEVAGATDATREARGGSCKGY
jgi:hypothetical protein